MKNLRNCKAKNLVPFSQKLMLLNKLERQAVYEDDYYTKLELEEAIQNISDILFIKAKGHTKLFKLARIKKILKDIN